MRLTFLLPDGSNRFIRMLGDTVGYSQEHLTPFNVKCRTELFESFNPQQLAASLLQQGKRSEGIAFMALEHPAVREAVSELAGKGVPTITLISDLSGSQRAGYVGLDNRAAGRTAGYLVRAASSRRRARRQGGADRRLAAATARTRSARPASCM